ncbi:MAG TPA: hypothetical protein VNF91_11250, partial [Candidatus Acidoferrum sp.]|nr:hypothetical protein [Candidatus Acidoferrum sp.]
MTRAIIDTNIMANTASSGKAALVSDPGNAFITQVIANLNEHAGALDTIGAPATGGMQETKTSGAATLTTLTTFLSTTNTVAYSLADGTVVGQRHIFEEITAGGTPIGTLTVATMDTAGGGVNATFVFNTIGQRLELEWTAGGWHVIRLVSAGTKLVTVGTTVLTGVVMNAALKLSVTGTVHSTLALGVPSGRTPGQRLHISVGTAAILPVGDIAITALTRTAMAAATSLANLTDTTMSL